MFTPLPDANIWCVVVATTVDNLMMLLLAIGKYIDPFTIALEIPCGGDLEFCQTPLEV
jgi:hypothetical protein